MGKHIKTSMDEKVIAYLAIEVHKLDPDNETLNKFRSMLTDTGYEIDKVVIITCATDDTLSAGDGVLSIEWLQKINDTN